MSKVSGDFEISLKHFNMALADISAEASFSHKEIKFHIAHVHEVRGESHKAKEYYEELLKEPELSNNLKADVFRQLGWMFHSVEALGERNNRLHTAIQYLQRSIECNTKKNHGQTLYLLGRCFAGKFIYSRESTEGLKQNQKKYFNLTEKITLIEFDIFFVIIL